MFEKLLQHQIGTGTWHIPLWTVLAAGFGVAWLVYRRGEDVRKRQPSSFSSEVGANIKKQINHKQKRRLKIFYGSQTGKGKAFAEALQAKVDQLGFSSSVVEVSPSYDHENLFTSEAEDGNIIILVISTYTDGQPPAGSTDFYLWLKDMAEDFRVTKATLAGLHFAVVGLGNSLYSDHFNTVVKNVDSWLHSLSANRILPLCLADENVINSINKGLEEDFKVWLESSSKNIQRALKGIKVTAKNCEDTCTKQWSCKIRKEGAEETDGGKCSSDEEELAFDSEEESSPPPKPGLDLKDLGNFMKNAKKSKPTNGETGAGDGPKRNDYASVERVIREAGRQAYWLSFWCQTLPLDKASMKGRYQHSQYNDMGYDDKTLWDYLLHLDQRYKALLLPDVKT